MHSPEQKICEVDYIPATLTEGLTWYVSFYAYNPLKERLDRKRIKVNRIKNKTLRREVARKLIKKINSQLEKGWSPFIEQEAPKSFEKLTDILDKYQKILIKDKMKKFGAKDKRENEDGTIRSYKSFIKFFKDYLTNNLKQPDMYVFSFRKEHATDLMNHIEEDEEKGIRTYNNYVTFYKALFTWMKNRNYVKVNPFSDIPKKQIGKLDKNRKPLPEKLIRNIHNYLISENINYLTAMLIEYYCLIRPKELSYLKISDIYMDRKLIAVRSEEAKNDNISHRTVPDILIPYLEKLDLSGDEEDYVFTNIEVYKFKPGKVHMDPRKFSKYWEKIRSRFGFGLEYKFYSLKDTGIIDYLESGVSIEDVRGQADHSDISVTGIYARQAKPKGSSQIREKAKDFA